VEQVIVQIEQVIVQVEQILTEGSSVSMSTSCESKVLESNSHESSQKPLEIQVILILYSFT